MKVFSDLCTLIKKKVTKDEIPTASNKTQPYRLRCGSFVEFENIGINDISENTNFGLCPDSQPVAALGKVDLGQHVYLNRYYMDDDETWMQFNMQGDINDVESAQNTIEEMILWKYHHTDTPTSKVQLKNILSTIGLQTIDLDGKTYERVWGEGIRSEMVEFSENVYIDKDDVVDYTVKHSCMLYRRAIPDSTRIEFYLISAEESGDGVLVVHSIGVSITKEDFKTF